MKSVVYSVERSMVIQIDCSTDLKEKLRSEYDNDSDFFGVSQHNKDLEAKCHLSFAGQYAYQRGWLAKRPDIDASVRQFASSVYKPYFNKMQPLLELNFGYIQAEIATRIGIVGKAYY